MLRFAVIGLFVGGSFVALSTVVEPGAPFVLASLLFGLLAPAVTITHREAGRDGVRQLLREAVRVPRRWWWLLVAGFALPAVAWGVAAPLGGGRQLTWSLALAYVLDLLLGAMVINIWEELAWTGFFQRRAAARWRPLAGSLVTAAFFTGIHLPLAADDARSAAEVLHNAMLIACVALGVRLIIARLDGWADRSLLVLGLLHSSFNATELVLLPAHDWVRLFVAVAAGVSAVALGSPGRTPTAPVTTLTA